MKTFALVGASGTGKSYQAMFLAQRKKIQCIIDDGLLIANNKVIAGTSAKREKTKIASVKHAIFFHEKYAFEMKTKLEEYNPETLLVLGTSEKMVTQIRERLDLPEYEEIISIEDISSPEDINTALEHRIKHGKHVIPVPTLEVRQDFSGYFLRALKIFNKKINTDEYIQESEKTIIRPTYSYMGEFTISDNVISQIIEYELKKLNFIDKINSIRIDKLSNGMGAEISVSIIYGVDIKKSAEIIKNSAAYPMINYVSVNVQYINVYVKSILV